MITSAHIKAGLLNYLRFNKGMVTATEVKTICGFADIMAYCLHSRHMIEVEVKTNIQDLKNEIRNKSNKHYCIKHPEKYGYKYIPNRYYICVPAEILEDAKPIIESINENYGIIVYTHLYNGKDDTGIINVKSAKSLHVKKQNGYLCTISKRLSCEVAKLRMEKLG